jgi:hypothetical protein
MAGVVAFQPVAEASSRSDPRVIERVLRKIDARLGA